MALTRNRRDDAGNGYGNAGNVATTAVVAVADL
jgi:hypothetical protein